jgi:hypothetical protein
MDEGTASLRETYVAARAAEDSGLRGGTTWRAYVVALRQYGNALSEGPDMALHDREELLAALAGAAAALDGDRIPAAVDEAVNTLRLLVDAHDRRQPETPEFG